jgi:hypothetical protein
MPLLLWDTAVAAATGEFSDTAVSSTTAADAPQAVKTAVNKINIKKATFFISTTPHKYYWIISVNLSADLTGF